MDMTNDVTGDILVRLLVALLGGALIGLERERARLPTRSEVRSGKADIPGLRSFGLLSLYGGTMGVIASLAPSLGGGSTVVVALGIAGFLGLYVTYLYSRLIIEGQTGLTTFIVMLLAFIIGFIAGAGLLIESASLSIVVTLVLSLKSPVERLVKAISYEELLALLEVSTLALVIGPILRALNPVIFGIDLFKVYVFFVIVLALSFTSYTASRLAGTKGLEYASLLGGIVNSEAAIGAISRIASGIDDEGTRSRLVDVTSALIISSMELRAILLLIAALYLFAGPYVAEDASPYLALIAVPALITAILMYKSGLPQASLRIESPISVGIAVRAALAYLTLTIAVKATAKAAGVLSLAIAGLGGLVNAGAAILGLTSAYGDLGLEYVVAGSALAIAMASINKMIYADMTRLGRLASRPIIKWSLLLSVPPIITAILALASP